MGAFMDVTVAKKEVMDVAMLKVHLVQLDTVNLVIVIFSISTLSIGNV